MARKKQQQGGARQLQMDWDRFQRDGWIEHAEIPDGEDFKGKLVKADKIKSLLLKLNSHLGKNAECFPSLELLAEKMSVSRSTVVRAVQAAQEMSLIVVKRKNRPGSTVHINHYRIIWSELLLLDKDRDRAFRDSVAGVSGQVSTTEPAPPTERSVLGTERSVLGTERSVLGTERSVPRTPELLTNKPKNNSKNPPLPHAAADDASYRAVAADYQVVVSVLKSLGVRAWRKAISAAIERQVTPADVLTLTERYKRLLSRDSRVTPAYLYRWITGDSDPPPEAGDSDHAATIPLRRSGLMSERTELEMVRSSVVQVGRRAGLPPDRLRETLRQALAKRGFDPERVPPDLLEV